MLPEGWAQRTVADICELRNGHGFGPDDWADEGLPIIRIQNLNGGKNFDYFAGQPDPRWLVEPGQLLFAWAGTKGVSFGPAIWRGPVGVLNQHIFKVYPREGIDAEWLYWALRYVTDRIEGSAHGFKATLVHVKKSDIDRQAVHVPPLAEQRQIAEVIGTWGRAIAAVEALVANGRKQKQALMHQLLGRKRQLKGLAADRRVYKMGELFSERVEANRSDLKLLSVTRDEGVIPRDEVGRKDTSNEDKSLYLRVCPGDIVYNTMRMWQGVSALSSLEGIVSPAYTVLKPSSLVEAKFAAYLFKYAPAIHLFYRYSQGLVSDTWNLKFSHFSKIKLEIPAVQEQVAIAKVLSDADHAIDALLRTEVALRTERQTLMAELMTGGRRLSLDSAESAP